MRSPRAIALILVTLAFGTPFSVHATCSRHRSFGESILINATGSTPDLTRMPVSADFNGDLLPDFAAHDSEYFRKRVHVKEDTRATTVGIYLNDSTPGNVKFLPAAQFLVGEAAGCYSCVNETDLQVADLNDDGAPDLVASLSANDAVYVLINKKLGKKDQVGFFPPIKLRVGEDPVWVRIGNFDEDIFPDIATVNLERRLVVSDVWSISYLQGNGDGTFQPANTLVLSDTDRLGFTDRNNVTPYERHETDVYVLPFPGGPSLDVLVTSGILVLPRVWIIEPGAKGFSQLKMPRPNINLTFRPGFYDRTGTAPIAFFDPFEFIGPGALVHGQRFKLLNPSWGDPANTELSDFNAANIHSLGRLESFHLADFDGDRVKDVFAFFTHAMVLGFHRLKVNPFAPLVGGAGEVQILRMFQRSGDDTPLYHSAAVADFDRDNILDILAGSDNPKFPLMIYPGQDIAQAGQIKLQQFMPPAVTEGGKVLFTGDGFLKPSRLLYATLTEVGGKGIWTVPILRDDILSQTQWALQVPKLGDAQFWKKKPGQIVVAVTVENACEKSNPPLNITVRPSP
ncbi:MAG TPA: hypothetical protein VNM67_07635 [Thermoanaerobaculia bacterium]|nr:hypothetical protein [Thermoanaerobaculia bacterium]